MVLATSCPPNFHLALFNRWQYAAVLGGFTAHLEVVIRFEGNFANSALGGFLVAVVSGHHTYHKRPVRGKNDAYIVPHSFQFSRLVRYLNIVGQQTWNVTLLQRR